MKYVLDANVALKWVLNEPESPQAVQLREEFRNGIHELLAPDIFPIEVAHAVARAERRGAVAVGDGFQKMGDVFTTMPDLHPYLPLLPRAFAIAIASRARIGVYDRLHVALAEQEGCELVTADTRMMNSLRNSHPFLVSLATL